jgi:hypothetical protein
MRTDRFNENSIYHVGSGQVVRNCRFTWQSECVVSCSPVQRNPISFIVHIFTKFVLILVSFCCSSHLRWHVPPVLILAVGLFIFILLGLWFSVFMRLITSPMRSSLSCLRSFRDSHFR